MNYSIGQVIKHNGVSKVITKVERDFIETIYLSATKSGWKRVERIHITELPQYKFIEIDCSETFTGLTPEELDSLLA